MAAPGAGDLAARISACTTAFAGACGGSLTDCLTFDGTGTLDDGAACEGSYQCKSSFCKTAEGSTCGTCAAGIPIGEPCPEDGTCVHGATCVQFGTEEPSGPRCYANRTAKEGESCESAAVGAYVTCDQGLTCSGDDHPTCKPLGKKGDACAYTFDCSESLACIANQCATPRGEGDACPRLNECANGLGCDPTTKKCVKKTFVKTGEACDQSARFCERGACDKVSFTGTDDAIEITPGKCVDALPDGASCNDDETSDDPGPPCDVFARCVGGKCVLSDPSQCK